MTGARREMVSVGIDVGTTTTQVAFSRLTLRDGARIGFAPRVEVDAAALLHAGAPQLTPLVSAEEIDASALAALIEAEYETAGIEPAKVETGAVIITGETARKQNAEALLRSLAGFAGEFVVSIAGPNVEAQIAGRGSGAAAHSAERFAQVTNVDIGGGTANAAIFRMGAHLESAALAVGGRQVEIDHGTGIVRRIAPPGARIVAEAGLEIAEGEPADLDEVTRLCAIMADLVVDLVDGSAVPSALGVSLTGPLRHAGASSALFLSGGVGACYSDGAPASTLEEVTRHGDVGPLLARCLREHPALARRTVLRPRETVRATVMGAATQTITLSGTTIWAEERLLPLRDLVVVRPHLDRDRLGSGSLEVALADALQRWDATELASVAVALDLPSALDYETLREIATGIAAHAATGAGDEPTVILTEHDYAKVLGQTIDGLRPGLPLVVVDQVRLDEGDRIDIGTPVLGGRVVPLSVKTLVFYS